MFLRVSRDIIAKYSPMDHKEQVRIAVSKALARLLPLMVELQKGELFDGQLYLKYAMILLLNDEQPDIRYYLCQSPALARVIDFAGQQPYKLLEDGYTVSVNDQFVVEKLFTDYTERILASGDEAVKNAYLNNYLIPQWILGNPYRDHVEKNYEDKIFFFEPINKFYDLLWVKRLAFNQALRLLAAGVPLTSITSQGAELDINKYY